MKKWKDTGNASEKGGGTWRTVSNHKGPYLQQSAFCRRRSFMAVRYAENRTLFRSAEGGKDGRQLEMKDKLFFFMSRGGGVSPRDW